MEVPGNVLRKTFSENLTSSFANKACILRYPYIPMFSEKNSEIYMRNVAYLSEDVSCLR